MYQATVPVYARLLTALSTILDKGEAYAKAKKVDPAVLITSRLYPDMFSLAEQVRATCNYPVRSGARLAGLPIPTFDGKDATFDDLRARIAWTIAFITGIDRAKIDGTDEKEIVFPSGDTQRKMSGRDYILAFAMPHFYFHLTTAYDILRHNGVPLVKDDYIGPDPA
jgi:hypothetical protein